MGRHIVIGGGGIGVATARNLVTRGQEVVLLSKSGPDSAGQGISLGRVDATDRDAVARVADGAQSIVNAMNPASYSSAAWEQTWPPIADALLWAAQRTGAGLVTVSNLYPYGVVDGPMVPGTPDRPNGRKGAVRAAMWKAAREAHEAGQVRTCELRASDYFGPGAKAGMSYLNTYVIAGAARGRTCRLPVGLPDAPHTWTYLPDIGELAAVLATDDRSWGRAWHVPSAPPKTMAEVADDVATLEGLPAPRVVRLPALVRALLQQLPGLRELDETAHQFAGPFVLDSSETEQTFGLAPTPWLTALADTAAALRRK